MQTEMSIIPFISPTTISISGSTGSGKTFFVNRLLLYKDVLFSSKPNSVIYCYNMWQPIFEKMKANEGIKFYQGLITEQEIMNTDLNDHTLLILDDLQHQLSRNKLCEKLLTQISHHHNVTVIYIVQNMFYPGLRTLSLNTHYNIVFKNLRDIGQIHRLARQCGMNESMTEAYKDAVSQPYGYLVIDLSPHQKEEDYRLRSCIFPDETTIIYKKR
jgi:dephospho-CoA kinase